MSYGVAAALQVAIYERLAGNATLGALVGGAIHDAVPKGRAPDLYVTFGPEEVRERGDGSGAGAEHRVTVSVISEAAGFLAAKQAAGAVSDALDGAALGLSRGRLVALSFLRARAVRSGAGQRRRVDLTFRARIDDSV
ncbi:DUF3168 domain-containing protein [Roseovarius autotrophicus]|uniref:DUF3168 domain-containing protein n=1 Tax=Roseovarius autotrophicus TaxID=2824121 RepID=UPI001B388065|nr:DUF3168 domain-containing protein [Roseovarius autotrophicus]